MISLKKLEDVIAAGEQDIKELEENSILELLREDTQYIIKVSMLKTLKFVRDSND